MQKKALFVFIVAGFFTAHTTFADIWRVNNNSLYTESCDHCFSNIQDAVNSSLVSPGDTIHIEASTVNYDGADITKPLTIIGPGYFLNENGQPQQNQIGATIASSINLMPGCEGTKLIGLHLDTPYTRIGIDTDDITITRCYSGAAGISFRNNNTTLNNIVISKCYISRIGRVSYPDPISNLHISNCYIENYVSLGSESNGYEGTFTQNVVGGNMEGGSGMDYYNNIFKSGFDQWDNSVSNVFNNIFTYEIPAWLSGGDNFNLPETTVFVAEGSTDGIHKVNPENICAECYMGYNPSGPNDEEMGMFGGNSPYVLSGIPNVPTIYELHNSANVYQGDTTHVTISTRSNF